jgi:hypothetical protein
MQGARRVARGCPQRRVCCPLRNPLRGLPYPHPQNKLRTGYPQGSTSSASSKSSGLVAVGTTYQRRPASAVAEAFNCGLLTQERPPAPGGACHPQRSGIYPRPSSNLRTGYPQAERHPRPRRGCRGPGRPRPPAPAGRRVEEDDHRAAQRAATAGLRRPNRQPWNVR